MVSIGFQLRSSSLALVVALGLAVPAGAVDMASQRAAITRALAAGPAVLVADEPTSALDSTTAGEVSQALLNIVKESDIALMLVTHDTTFAERCDRTFRIIPPSERNHQE